MTDQISNLPCGQTIPPNNIHAVSVSLPRMSDVIGYEEKQPNVVKKIQSGYPRFVTHPFIVKIQRHINKKYRIDNNSEVILVSSHKAVDELSRFVGKQVEIIEDQNIIGVLVKGDSTEYKDMRSFLQHTGYIPSSRLTEQYLLDNGLLPNKFVESLNLSQDPQEVIINVLGDAYGLKDRDGVSLGVSGMNAVYTAFRAVECIQQKRRRHIFIQLGWQYLDTMEIIRKFSREYVQFESIFSLDRLRKFLEEKGDQTAAIFTEVTSNPLIQTPDLPTLYSLARQYDIPVVVDATFGTPFNVDVIPYSDIIIESLTKFACGNADLMMGAIIVKDSSPWCSEMMKNIPTFLDKPFEGDVRRLAIEIKAYKERMERINQNTLALIDYFRHCKKINEIYWSYQDLTRENYLALQKHSNAVGGVISLVFDQPLEKIYDKINLPKGPSLGTEFTLLMPYVYLAHYDLISTSKGRKYLASVGIPPDLLRVSVGTEKVETIIERFDEAINDF